jgi:hypothetical protein
LSEPKIIAIFWFFQISQLEFAVAATSLAKSEITGLHAATQSPPELQAFLEWELERVATLE